MVKLTIWRSGLVKISFKRVHSASESGFNARDSTMLATTVLSMLPSAFRVTTTPKLSWGLYIFSMIS